MFEKRDGSIIRENIPQLVCEHFEADTRLVWHMKFIEESHPSANVAIRYDDADILVIMLAHVVKYGMLDVGKNYNNTERYIDVTTLAQHLGPDSAILCQVFIP